MTLSKRRRMMEAKDDAEAFAATLRRLGKPERAVVLHPKSRAAGLRLSVALPQPPDPMNLPPPYAL